MTNKRTPIIRYTSRDFQSIKNDIIEYGKRNYGDSFKDQAFVGFGANLVDNIALVGDMLSFYLDYNVNESFLETAVEYDNVVRNAKQIGYKFKGNPSSAGEQTFYIIVPASNNGTGPDNRYRGILKRGTTLNSVNGDGFILTQDVNFNNTEKTEVRVANVNTNTGVPTSYAIRAKGNIISGRIVQEIIEVGDYQRFLRLELQDPNISEILNVVDSEGNEYFEVDSLAQDIIYRGILNRDSDTNDYAARLLRPFVVPRRFVVDRDFTTTFLQFGYGSERDLDVEPLIDPSSVILEQYGKDYISDISFDPTKLLSTDKLGISPSNTTLLITYRTNEGQNLNAAVDSVTEVTNPIFEFDNINDLDAELTRGVINSIETTNETSIVGDTTLITQQEIKERAKGSFASQKRAVTLLDYKTYTYQMPPEYGSIKRVNIVQDNNSFKRNLNFYVISEDAQGLLIETNSVIKENLKQWLSRGKMINDTIDILDAKIVNYSIEYVVLGEIDVDKGELERRCNIALAQKTAILPEIGEPIFVSEFYKVLQELDNVVDVEKIRIREKVGGSYSNATFDFKTSMSTNNRYIKVPKNVIMELRFPNVDIKGVVK